LKLLAIDDALWGLHWYLSKAYEYPGVHKKLRDLKEEGVLKKPEWQNLQIKRLRRLLRFAQHKVPYYRELFKSVQFNPETANLPNELQQLPILTKDIIKNHLEDILAVTVNKTDTFENTTGGSTGVPLRFYQDLEYQTIAEAIDTYVREWWGIKPYNRTALIWGADQEFYELSLKERLYKMRQRTKSLNAFRMTEESLLEFCQILARWRPPYLMGYASALESLAKCAMDNRIDGLNFTAIRSTAEMLFPEQRELIEEVLNGPVFNFYGSREVSNIAAECPEEKRLHLISTWRYVEIVDDKGFWMPDGESGSIAITDLSNYAMPFIRYLNEDMACMAIGPCPCGRPSPVIDELLGRRTDIIRTARGDIIHGEYFTHLFYGRNDIRQFQVHQTDLNHLVIRYVPINKPPEEYIKNVVKKILERLGDEVKVKVELCDRIPLLSSGKFRFTISDVTGENLQNVKK